MSVAEKEPRTCARPGCQNTFVPYRSIHRYCSQSCSQRGKNHEVRNKPRAYKCQIPGCGRPGVAKGYCNAHYTRLLNGREMTRPVTVRDPSRPCGVSGCHGKHYGNGYCKKHFGLHRRLTTTRQLITALGGRCADCGGVFPAEVFDFHHTEGKDFAISAEVGNLPYDKLLLEAKKCILLCANCHRVRHATYHVIDESTL